MSAGHIIVCGIGQVGYLTAKLLARMGEKVTVISKTFDDFYEDPLRRLGVTLIHGDARLSKTLNAAGIKEARAVIVCTSMDLLNIEIALDAKKLRPEVKLVVRLFDRTLATQMEKDFGISKVLAMSRLSAPAFAAAALGESVKASVTVEGAGFIIVRAQDPVSAPFKAIEATRNGNRVDALAPLEAIKADLLEKHPMAPVVTLTQEPANFVRGFRGLWSGISPQLRRVAVVLLSLIVISVFVFQFGMGLSTVDAVYFVITTVATVGYGDITPKDAAPWLKLYACLLMVMGSATVAVLFSIVTDFVVSARFDQLRGKKASELSNHVIIVGLGDVGLRTSAELHQLSMPTVVVDLDPDNKLRGFLPESAEFLAGEGRDTQILLKAGLTRARAVVTCTEDDATNLSIALAVKAIRPGIRVVTRLFDENFAAKVEEVLSVDSALSSPQIAAPAFAGAALFDDAQLCYESQGSFIALREADLGDPDVYQIGPHEVQLTTIPLRPVPDDELDDE